MFFMAARKKDPKLLNSKSIIRPVIGGEMYPELEQKILIVLINRWLLNFVVKICDKAFWSPEVWEAHDQCSLLL